MIDVSEVTGIRVAPEESILGVLLVTEDCVVHDRNDDVDAVASRRLELRPDVTEASVTDDTENRPIGTA
jgi:hypothetical protein